MTRTGRLLGLLAVLALVLAGPSLLGAEEGLKTDSEKLDEALRKLTEIQKSLDRLEKIRKEINDVRTDANVSVQAALESVDKMNGQIAQLRRDLEEVRKRSGTTTRVSAYGPEGSGRVVLTNEYPVEMEVIVNQNAYRIAPNMAREIQLAAGPFTFRVPGAPGFETTQNRLLPANYNYQITIHP